MNIAFDQPIQMLNYTTIDFAGGYHQVVVPYLQATGVLDLRYAADGKHDGINPHYGFYFSNDVQLAVADSQDVRVKPEMRGYVPIGKKVTLALRAAGGVLYAFGGDLSKSPTPGCPFGVDPSLRCVQQTPSGATVDRARYIQVLQLRGFTSGGPTSNRGYAYSGVGPQEFVPNISTVQSNGLLAPIATGGSALWEASAELRFPVYGALGGALFLDGSDVRFSWAQMGAPFAPHLSTGVGLRYLTPVGPFRADFGLRIPGAQVLDKARACPIFDPNGTPLQSTCYQAAGYGQAGPIVFGNTPVPLTVSLAIGEAY
jgi:outer membrane protein assembly factor BamA